LRDLWRKEGFVMAAKRIDELTEKEEKRATELYEKAIVIECLTYAATLAHPEYIRETRDAGVTATHFTVLGLEDNILGTLDHLAGWYEMVKQNDAIIACTADDIVRAKEEKRPCVIWGAQNAKPLEEDLKYVRILHALGLRIIQLAYDQPNYIGTGGSEPDSGITKFGRKVIEEMNRVGMLIDVSHCGDQTVMDAIKYSQDPIAITHANPRAMVNHTRNKTDEQMLSLAEKGGVIGLVAWSPIAMVRKGVRPNLEDFLDLMEYIVKLIGVDHVGIGLDLTPHWDWDPDDYYRWIKQYPGLAPENIEDRNVEGLDHVSKVKNMARGLVARGYSDDDVLKVLGGNFLNLFRKVWKG
jgi:membrane dipeptidase